MNDNEAGLVRLEHRLVSSNGIRLHVVDAGPSDGEPVLLLHGFPDFWWGWRRVFGSLAAAGRRVIVPDMRGNGRSEAPRGSASYALDILADDIFGLIDELGINRCCLVGHDWGGVVAWSVAARRPQSIAKLIAVAAPHPDTLLSGIRRDPVQLVRSLYIGLFQLPLLPEIALSMRRFALLRRALANSSVPGTFSATDLEHYCETWRGLGRIRAMLGSYRALSVPRAPVGRIAVPTQILWAGRDRFLGGALGRLALERCDDARLTVLRDATHWVPHEHSQDIVAAVLSEGGERRSPSSYGPGAR